MQAGSDKDSLTNGMLKCCFAESHSYHMPCGGCVPAPFEKLLNLSVKPSGFIKKSTKVPIFSLFLHDSYCRRVEVERDNYLNVDQQQKELRKWQRL